MLVIGGVLLLMGKRGRINRLESEAGVSLNINKPFESAIKKHDLGKIDRALAKIGTGKGSEHRLKGQLAGHYSIDAGEGERVIFDYDNPQHSSATPIDYLSDHDYKRLQR
jgi:plasmid maintenance system killer protein